MDFINLNQKSIIYANSEDDMLVKGYDNTDNIDDYKIITLDDFVRKIKANLCKNSKNEFDTKITKEDSKYNIKFKGKNYIINAFFISNYTLISELEECYKISTENEALIAEELSSLKKERAHYIRLLSLHLLIVLSTLILVPTSFTYTIMTIGLNGTVPIAGIAGTLIPIIAFAITNYDAFGKLEKLSKSIKPYNNNIKMKKKELSKKEIIDKIKEINKENQFNLDINIDRKTQQTVDKLLNKLKKILEKGEYQSAVDEIYNERVLLEDDEYTITDEQTTNIESGSIAYANPINNAVKKKAKVLLRR